MPLRLRIPHVQGPTANGPAGHSVAPASTDIRAPLPLASGDDASLVAGGAGLLLFGLVVGLLLGRRAKPSATASPQSAAPEAFPLAVAVPQFLHDLRNDLMVIEGSAELVRMQNSGAASVTSTPGPLDDLALATERLRVRASDLGNALKESPEPASACDLGEALRSVLAQLGVSTEGPNIRAKVMLACVACPTHVRPNELRVALTAWLLRILPETGGAALPEIRLTCSATSKRAIIEVTAARVPLAVGSSSDPAWAVLLRFFTSHGRTHEVLPSSNNAGSLRLTFPLAIGTPENAVHS